VDGEQHPSKVALRRAREQVLEQLSEGFAKDEIGLDEFERRVDDAYRATSAHALAPLVADLATAEGAPVALETSPRALSLVAAATRPTRALAILGSTERRGRFRVDDGMQALAVLGNVELDLREVELPPGVTHLYVRAICGNVEITVPPTLAVECEGTTVLGNFETVSRVPPEGSEGPLLRIIGSAFLGNVEIHTRPRHQSVDAGPRTKLLATCSKPSQR
jgi:hypothetical protein